MRLSEFVRSSLEQTGKQIRLTRSIPGDYGAIYFVVGDIDFQSIKMLHGERFIQHFITKEITPDTMVKVRTLRRLTGC